MQLIDLNTAKIFALSMDRKLYMEVNKLNFQIPKLKKIILGYKCTKWVVTNDDLGVKATYWVAKDLFLS